METSFHILAADSRLRGNDDARGNDGTVENSTVIEPVFFGEGVTVKNSTVGPNVVIESGSTILDFYAAVPVGKKLFADGVHPNVAGAELMAKAAFTAITGKTEIPEYISAASIFSSHMVLQLGCAMCVTMRQSTHHIHRRALCY